MSNIHTARVAAVRSIGKGIRVSETLTDEIVDALTEQVNAGTDIDARGFITGFVSEWVNGDKPAPAQRTGGKGGPRTDYGIGFDALVSKVKAAVKLTDPKPEALKVTYVDADGASHTVAVGLDTDMGADLLALFAADAE